MLKQLLKPLDENDIFLSTATEQITWKELDDNLDKKSRKAKRTWYRTSFSFCYSRK